MRARAATSGTEVVALLALLAGPGSAQQPPSDTLGDARIACSPAAEAEPSGCRAALPIYIGWRVFGEHCAVCHGSDALGSDFAPDLTRRIARMDQRRFVAALDHGYLGPNDRTPPRGADPDVGQYYAELWAYLRARASGALPEGAVVPLRDGLDAN